MHTLPCGCPVCSGHTIDELKYSDEKVKLLAKHNLLITNQEIKIIKEAIFRGSLWELVENRCRAHPHLLDALRIQKEYPLERYEPLSKRTAFFYTGPESLFRPEVKRHLQRLSRIVPAAKSLVLLPLNQKQHVQKSTGSNNTFHVCYVSPVFGIIPTEVEEVYPLTQHIAPNSIDDSQLQMMKKRVSDYGKKFDKVYFDHDLEYLGINGEVVMGLELERDTSVKLKCIGDYQFGKGAGKVLFEGCRGRYALTGRLRHILDGEDLVATVRASDGIIIPTLEGAKRLLKLSPPKNRVVIEDEEVCEFVRMGRSVFSKFIDSCDPEIIPGSEVIVVNKNDELVGWGKALLDARELLAFNGGVGVKTRGSLKK
jgi:7-cyano-7-deazaguanine tRNA-ribosyltransferase